MDSDVWDFSGLRALFINCTLKRSPEVSNTQALVDASRSIMEQHGVSVESVRLIDHDVATGIYPDMTEHGWKSDEWPALQDMVFAAHILVLAGPIWLGDNSSVMKRCIERLYATSHLLNDAGQYALLRTRRRLPHHGQRGWHQTLCHEHPLQPPAPRLQHSPSSRCGLDWRGGARTLVP